MNKTRAWHQDGYKAHVKVEPDVRVHRVDHRVRVDPGRRAGALRRRGRHHVVGREETDPIEVLGDSAYGTGELLAAVTGHTAIITPWPLRPAVDGGFTHDEFTLDEAAGTVTCLVLEELGDERRNARTSARRST